MSKDDFTAKMYPDGKIVIPIVNRKLRNIEPDDYVTCKIIEVTKKEDILSKESIEDELSQ